jgi:hypothetical protein
VKILCLYSSSSLNGDVGEQQYNIPIWERGYINHSTSTRLDTYYPRHRMRGRHDDKRTFILPHSGDYTHCSSESAMNSEDEKNEENEASTVFLPVRFASFIWKPTRSIGDLLYSTRRIYNIIQARRLERLHYIFRASPLVIPQGSVAGLRWKRGNGARVSYRQRKSMKSILIPWRRRYQQICRNLDATFFFWAGNSELRL